MKDNDVLDKPQQTKTTQGFLRLPEVLKLIPIGKSTLWSRVKDGTFPRPVKLSPRVTVWNAEEVYQFIQDNGHAR